MKQETAFFVVINILPNYPPYTPYYLTKIAIPRR